MNQESLVGLSADLVLKHGSHVPGEWNMLGVLDATRGPWPDPENPNDLSGSDKIVADLAGSEVAVLAARLSAGTRKLLGRPHVAYGVTPLLIFREVSG